MSLAEELVQLHQLFKDGAITKAEFETLKGRVIRGNLSEAKSLLLGNKNNSNVSPLQLGAMAAAGTFAGRMIADHLKSDRELQAKLDTITEAQLNGAEHIEYREVTYQSSENDFSDTSDMDFGF